MQSPSPLGQSLTKTLRIFVEQTAWHRPPQPGRISAGVGDQRASRSRLLLSLSSHPASKGRAEPPRRKRAAHRLRGSSFCASVPHWASRILEQEKIPGAKLSEQMRDKSIVFTFSEARYGVSSNHPPLDGGAHQRVSGLPPLQHNPSDNLSVTPMPNLWLIHKHCFYSLPSVLHIISYIHTPPSLLVHLPTWKQPPFSRCLSHFLHFLQVPIPPFLQLK